MKKILQMKSLDNKSIVIGCMDCIEGITPSTNQCVLDVDDDFLNNFYRYKIVDGELVKMVDEEFNGIYPDYGVKMPTDIEVLQQENHLLKAQVKALTNQGEFQDELIAEIATVVYA